MKQIGIDFQGWPINALTLREILYKLGFEENLSGNFVFTGNPEFLDSYPLTLEDDGMAYGVRPMLITEVDHEIYEDEDSKLNVFNVFRERYRQINNEAG
jgi:hypothetical protein